MRLDVSLSLVEPPAVARVLCRQGGGSVIGPAISLEPAAALALPVFVDVNS